MTEEEIMDSLRKIEDFARALDLIYRTDWNTVKGYDQEGH